VGVPLIIFVLCLCAGAVAGARWLPSLDVGPIAGLAFFAVCGLLGLAVALLGEHIYVIVHEVENLGGGPGGLSKGEVVGAGLKNIALDEGTVLGITAAVYLLAPRLDRAGAAAEEPAQQP
jgi:hypothetical protein